MTTLSPVKLVPWLDRWSEPTPDQLMEPLDEAHRKVLGDLLEHINKFDHIRSSLAWRGVSWHWTLEYLLHDPEGNKLDTFCYVVPNTAGPQICIPLTDAIIHRLPFRRLHKFVRNGIRSAKRAVVISWATWNLNAPFEVELLADLVKRKHKILLEPFKPAKPKNNRKLS